MPAQKSERNNLKGAYWMLVSVIAAAITSVAVREMSASVDSRAIVFFRFFFAVGILIVAIGLFPRFRHSLRFSNPKIHILRGLLIAFSTHMGFYTLTVIPLATATVLFFTAPIYVTLLNMVIHGERAGIRRWVAILLGFCGVVIILRPGFSEISWGMITALISSFTFAVALSMTRNITQADGPMSTLFSAALTSMIVSIPVAWPVMSMPDSTWVWFLVLSIVMLGFARQYADISAYTLAEASVLAPVAYLRIVFIGIAGYFIYSEIPDTPTIVGAIIIVSATAYIAERERQLGKKRKAIQSP